MQVVTMSQKKRVFLILGILMSFLFCVSQASHAATTAAAPQKKHVIVIDPAHGGQDAGIKMTGDSSEKNVTLAVALAVKKELSNENNLDIILTRDADKEISLEDRRKNIEKIKPDLLISLHVNAGFGKSASGFEIYYPDCSGDSTKDKKKAKDDKAQLRNKCQNDSLKMANIVQENLNALFPRKGRGLRKADLPVSDGLLVPAMSVEMGFATSTEDKKKLLSTKTQTDIARALAKSVKTFFR
jgi:N-acetylmuramoyl-L-alanine amidase